MPDQPTDMNQEQYLAQRQRSVAETFGEDVIMPVFTDQPQPTARSSAKRLAQLRAQNEAEITARRQTERLAKVAQEDREDQALELAIDQIQRRQRVPTGTRILATRALERAGGSGLSSAETLAGPTLARMRREAQDQDTDTDRRRAGRRPRS
jgi:hypothetical protein